MPKAKWVDLEKWYKFMNKIRAFAAVCGGYPGPASKYPGSEY